MILSSTGGIDWQAIDGKVRPTLYTLDTAKRIVEGHYTTVEHGSGQRIGYSSCPASPNSEGLVARLI
jgi:hypothetical protein